MLATTKSEEKIAEETCSSLTEELKELRDERKLLESVSAEKEKIQGEKKELINSREKFKNLISAVDALEVEQKTLTTLQKAYLVADAESSKLKQIYDAQNKAFLDEQAGIIASTLIDGVPCPVCGALEHPCLARMSEAAPTEADVKKAKNAYETAQKKTEQASGKANIQHGVVTSAQEAILKESSVLLGDVVLDLVNAEATKQEAALSAQILDVQQKIADTGKKELRKVALDSLIPHKEQTLSETEKSLVVAKEQNAALTAASAELTAQITALRTKLTFTDKAAVLEEIAALTQRLNEPRTELSSAEAKYNTCKEELASIRAAMEQLKIQLAEPPTQDAHTLTELKSDLTIQKSVLSLKTRRIHTQLSVNSDAKKNISHKEKEMMALDEHYTWLKALSDTANGTVAGKDKIMLETYIQTTYFDRILERANLRLRKMSGGQYDLERRRTAENKRSQSGLDLDIIDHINTTRRSVNTLSGGEAFLASLALALGLSDEVQMSTGIQLNTLFVDEGFGSLDSEALSKAYLTLAGLTEGNRLVGIISHVAELKEKIDRQIVVKKERSGGSRATITV